jgi:Second Messenger Oligonucleotide or Dinucleotide Synthetase domain
MTVSEAFQTLKSELELPDRKQKQAATAQQEVRERISAHLYVPDSILTGSYARYTKINPLSDIDVLLIRNRERVGLSIDGSGVSAGRALDEVVEAVRKAYPYAATVKKQSRSVNVQLTGLEFGFDIIPAWLRSPDGYWIPDADTGYWLPSDPDAHAKIMTLANDHCGGKLKPCIKMVKHWSRQNYDLIRSFHLELICADIFSRDELTNFPIGVATVLVRLSVYVGQTVMDPIYGSSRVDKPLTPEELTKLTARVNYDAQNAVEALRLENAGLHNQAIEKWKHIFLTGFPG